VGEWCERSMGVVLAGIRIYEQSKKNGLDVLVQFVEDEGQK
jgi:hypothetical protein